MNKWKAKKKADKKAREEKDSSVGGVSLKEQGSRAFAAQNFDEAIRLFSAAIVEDPTNAILYSNRSACYAQKPDFDAALRDAEETVTLSPAWSKGYLRRGQALEGLMQLQRAMESYREGAARDSEDAVLRRAMEELNGLMEDMKLSQREAASTVNPEEDRFESMIAWLKEGNAQFSLLYLQYYDEDYRGVHAVTKIPNNRIILEVPLSHIMTSDVAKASDIGQKIIKSGCELNSTHSYLASYLLQEKHNPNSFWKPYVRILPQHYKNMPIFFEGADLDLLKGSFAIRKIIDRQEELKEEFENICFPESDTRVLTDSGLLFLDQIEARLERGERVRYACFERDEAAAAAESDSSELPKGKLVYRDGQLKLYSDPKELVVFSSSSDKRPWAADRPLYSRASDEEDGEDSVKSERGSGVLRTEECLEDDAEQGDSNPSSRHISLRVTRRHQMYVQHGQWSRCASAHDDLTLRSARSAVTGRSQVPRNAPPSLVDAASLLSRCDCSDVDCTHRRRGFRMLSCADGGRVPSAEESAWVRSHVQAALKLTDEQLPTLLDFLGYWLGNGKIGYVSLPGGAGKCRAVSCSQVVEEGESTLQACVQHLALDSSDYSLLEQPLKRHNQPDARIAHLQITAPRWVELFERDFGLSRNEGKPRCRSVSRSLSTASTVLDEPTVDEASEEALSDVESDEQQEAESESNRLPTWVLMCLTPAQLSLVIRGLWRSAGDKTQHTPRILTSDAALCDQLVQALLHCGVSPFATLSCKAGAISAYQWHDASVDDSIHSVSEVQKLSESERAQYTPIRAAADQWGVSWSTPASDSGRRSCWPSMRNHRDVSTQPFSKRRDGRIWCVEVDSPEHAVIVAQRAERSNGCVTAQSRPVLCGNCRHVPEYRSFGLDEFVWARLVVITRIFGLVVSGNKTDGLVPMADMLNHKRPRETSWTFDDSRGSFTITSLRPMLRGEQIYDSYGRKCNSRFFVNYGFSLDDNEDNQIAVWVGLQRDDAHYAMKCRYMGGPRAGAQLQRFQIPVDYKEKAAKECFSFLRFAHAKDSELLLLSSEEKEVNVKDIAPLSIRNELSVVRHIARAVESALREFDSSVEEDEALLRKSSLSMNERNAILMRKGEKEVGRYYVELEREMDKLVSMPWKDFKRTAQKAYSGRGKFDAYVTGIVVPLLKGDH